MTPDEHATEAEKHLADAVVATTPAVEALCLQYAQVHATLSTRRSDPDRRRLAALLKAVDHVLFVWDQDGRTPPEQRQAYRQLHAARDAAAGVVLVNAV